MPSDLVLVDPKELQDLIDNLDLDEAQKKHITGRWLKYVIWWDSRANHAKKRYQFMRCTIIIAGALIPALVSIRELKVWDRYGWTFAMLSIIASVTVAICAGLDTFFNYGAIWREKRAAAELLKSEGHSFFMLSNPYRNAGCHKNAFPDFAANMESIIRQEIKDYVLATSEKDKNKPPGSPPVPA